MAYTQEQKDDICQMIFENIERGRSVRDIFNQSDMPNRSTFFEWLKEDKDKSDQYARACEARADSIFEEVLEIADKQGEDMMEIDGIEVVNHNVIARSRLQVDARKWVLAKMNPKKYGDKIEQNVNINTEQPLFGDD